MDSEPVIDEHDLDNNSDLLDDDDDGENVISLNKIKSSINLDPDQKSIADVFIERAHEDNRKLLPEINLQEPFQPSSTPLHLFSRYMVSKVISFLKNVFRQKVVLKNCEIIKNICNSLELFKLLSHFI